MDSYSILRPSKRQRQSVPEEAAGTDEQQVTLQATSSSRTRGATACRKCRARKTKCDNHRPSCSYCSKIGTACVYDDDAPTCACTVTSAQVLDAIGKLSNIVERRQNQCSSCSRLLLQETVSPARTSIEVLSEQFSSPATHFTDGSTFEHVDSEGPFGKSVLPTIYPQGIESILKWTIFSQFQVEGCLFAGAEDIISPSASLPTIDRDELFRLKDKYLIGVHSKNPILDMDELHGKILQVAESGFDWSTDACLVALVCAIGALSQQYQDHHLSPSNQPTPGAPQSLTSGSMTGCEPHLSRQFWNLAVKRLGIAIGQSDLQATQCLCLAGIWYMHQMAPLQAWKYFNLAGSVWFSLDLVNQASGQHHSPNIAQQSVTVTQALYFTIWKSICELRLEIDVPGIFDNVGLPHKFPQAPNLGDTDHATVHSNDERYWFYYLAEIAARHQINRIANAMAWKCAVPTGKDVRRMLALAAMLKNHLDKWHASLPPMFSFDIPVGHEIAPHPDDFIQILRHRYLTCRELISRPFLRLCVENPLTYEEPLKEQIVSLASVCLQYCMLKLSQVAPHYHQGTWFGLRNAASSTLLLCSVGLAHRNPSLPGSRALESPHGWQITASEAFRTLSPLWRDNRGGASKIGQLVQSALAASTDDMNLNGEPWED